MIEPSHIYRIDALYGMVLATRSKPCGSSPCGKPGLIVVSCQD